MKNEGMKSIMSTAIMRERSEQRVVEQRQGPTRSFLIMALTFLISHFSFLVCNAQTFTERIQQQTAGQGTVTIHQSADIDKLVNSTALASPKPATTAGGSTPDSNATPTGNAGAANSTTTTNRVSQLAANPEQEQAPVDMSKKVMRGGIKVNGYRVQAFAGGNSRKDRQKAEQTGNNIKQHFPNVPVYVHFYSPRWICRIGNYRTYEEAHQMLVSLRSLGYTQASIVKGKITVPAY